METNNILTEIGLESALNASKTEESYMTTARIIEILAYYRPDVIQIIQSQRTPSPY